MIIWSIEKLKKNIIEEKVSEKDYALYFIIMFFIMLNLVLCFSEKSECRIISLFFETVNSFEFYQKPVQQLLLYQGLHLQPLPPFVLRLLLLWQQALQVALLIISGKKLFKPVLVWALVGAATEPPKKR